MELVYQYLTGMKFRQRVEAVIEKFKDMREDLDRERRFMGKQWSKREAQISAVVDSTVGMVGDLQGIAGKAMPDLDLPLLEAATVRKRKYRDWQTSRRSPLPSGTIPVPPRCSPISGIGRNGKSSRFRRHASMADTSASVIITGIRRSLSRVHQRCLA